MHPAYSVIFFTVASGAGYGLLATLAVLGVANALPASAGFAWTSLVAAFALITVGLLASTVHLGHPERAWRAISQWRSSWLSREGLLAILTYPVAAIFAVGWLFLADGDGELARLDGWVRAAALATAVLALATVLATAMIYRSLAPIHQWHNDWVPAGYLGLGAMSGGAWLFALGQLFGVGPPWLGGIAAALIALGLSLNSPLKKASLTGFHATAKHIAAKAGAILRDDEDDLNDQDGSSGRNKHEQGANSARHGLLRGAGADELAHQQR